MTNTLCDSNRREAEAQYLETISLLQEEVARLEGELLAHQTLDPSLRETAGQSIAEAAEPDAVAVSEQEKERLVSELESRDETISLLLDQLRVVEEAERATRAEWEQLAGWLAEVEQRVEQRDREATGGGERIAELEQRGAEALALHERDRTAWVDERRELRRENERLQTLVRERSVPRGKSSSDASQAGQAVKVLESENGRLRQRCKEIETEGQMQVAALTEELVSTRRELEESRKQAAAVEDERVRERREYETAIASVRAQTLRVSLHSDEHSGSDDAVRAGAEASGPLEADLRIREFRQHLREIHSQEEELRNRNRLSARLSRLWSRTAPGS
jgi:hypothetical protein